MNKMLDPYLQLINIFRQKEQITHEQWLKTKDRDLKSFAEAIANCQPSNSVQRFDAAFAYYIAGYYARAYNLVMSDDIPANTPRIQRWLCLFLIKKFETLASEIQTILTESVYSDAGLCAAITSGDFVRQMPSDVEVESEIITHILLKVVAECLRDFLTFVRTGDDSLLPAINARLSQCEKLAVIAHESQWWWWLVCARFVMEEFAENSLWKHLESMRAESEIVAQYIKANYARPNPIVELWRSQIESLPSVNDLNRRSFCLKMPTGAGKTRVAELMILRFLLDYQAEPSLKSVYIAPFRTLANEVEETLRSSFRSIPNAEISRFYGGYEVDLLDKPSVDQARILVMTPEKLDGMLRQYPQLMAQIRLIIVDEGHIIGEKGDRAERGLKYQMILQRIIYALKIKRDKAERLGARLLFISGVLSNTEDFAEWLTGDRNNAVKSPWRPIDEPEFSNLTWNGANFIDSNNQPILLPPIASITQQRFVTTKVDEEERSFVQAVARAAVYFAMREPTLLFSASKALIKSSDLLAVIEDLVRSQGFEKFPLVDRALVNVDTAQYCTLLELGVAVHHGDLSPLLRSEIEKRIYGGQTRLILASPTLAQGVNLSVFTMLVCGLEYGQRGNDISSSVFWNVVGRVGRPTPSHFENGARPKVWFLLNSLSDSGRRDKRIQTQLLTARNNIRVTCAFLDFLLRIKGIWRALRPDRSVEELVVTLAENDLSWIANNEQKQELQRFLALLDGHLNNLSIESQRSPEPAEDCLQEVTGELVRLLQGVDEISDSDLAYIKDAIQARARFASKIPADQRRQDYLLGLPVDDRDAIRAKQQKLLGWYLATSAIFAGKFEEGIEPLSKIMEFIESNLNIVRGGINLKDKPLADDNLLLFDLSNIPTRSDMKCSFFKSWINGDDEEKLSSQLSRVNSKLQFDRYRENVLETGLPWGMGAVCRFLSDVAREQGITLVRDLDYLPSLVKYGVPSAMACYFVRIGFSRTAATHLWQLYLVNISRFNAAVFDVEVPMDALLPLSDAAKIFLENLSREDVSKLDLEDKDLEMLASFRAARVAPLEAADGEA